MRRAGQFHMSSGRNLGLQQVAIAQNDGSRQIDSRFGVLVEIFFHAAARLACGSLDEFYVAPFSCVHVQSNLEICPNLGIL